MIACLCSRVSRGGFLIVASLLIIGPLGCIMRICWMIGTDCVRGRRLFIAAALSDEGGPVIMLTFFISSF